MRWRKYQALPPQCKHWLKKQNMQVLPSTSYWKHYGQAALRCRRGPTSILTLLHYRFPYPGIKIFGILWRFIKLRKRRQAISRHGFIKQTNRQRRKCCKCLNNIKKVSIQNFWTAIGWELLRIAYYRNLYVGFICKSVWSAYNRGCRFLKAGSHVGGLEIEKQYKWKLLWMVRPNGMGVIALFIRIYCCT